MSEWIHFVGFTLIALLLDRVLGDPSWFPHPVIGMGWVIRMLDDHLNKAAWKSVTRRWFGIVTVCVTMGIVSMLSWGILALASLLSSWAYGLLAIAMIWTTIAWKGLGAAGRDVDRVLRQEGLVSARQRIGNYVGRDTDALNETEVVRATVETLAENIVDAIISPLFFACLGGPILALVYRAINTMDSMLGYRNARYQDFGWAAARLDDVANFIPARLTTFVMIMAIWLSGLPARSAYRAMKRDAHLHPSPNGGIPESLMAGALGVQLGGLNYYGGVAHARALLGDPLRVLVPEDIKRALRVLEWVGWLCVLGTTLLEIVWAMCALHHG